MDNVCVWEMVENGWHDPAYWETSCGGAAEFVNGGPSENDFVYCPFCGKKIREEVTDDC